MKAADIHKMQDDELKIEAKRLRRHLFDLRTQSVTEKIEDVTQFSKTRKDIARLLTEARKREMEREAQA